MNCHSYCGHHKNGHEFVLIVVLFILLVIVGAHFLNNGY